MTELASRSRRRGLKTWSAFGDLGRRPSDYEIVTHHMNHTTRPGEQPLEMGPHVRGNVWLRTHRDGMRLVVPDWDAFRDPDAVTYSTYVTAQDDQETYVEGLLERFDEAGHDEGLSDSALGLLRRVLAPSRFLAHGLQMLSSYVQQLAPSSYVGNCATFQTADQLRRVQLAAYRTTQLRLTRGTEMTEPGERWYWENDPAWQPIRKAVERALLEFDWDRAFVVTNLVTKPLTDLITVERLGAQAEAVGAPLDALILQNLYLDCRRSRRWTFALVSFLVAADPGNRAVLQEHLDSFGELARGVLDAAGRLLEVSGGQPPQAIVDTVRSAWCDMLAPHGLTAPRG
ncbi:toluene 4-monooxygenase protein E [Pseudonocardia thermophila]|jgi:Methane/Phenol/Toluene Hydroxylase.|uniref:propane 2-monooxygenase n=1 Tax=Pseudonocardia thermophila TaxID=1848 RepID=A0A1M6PPG2_PSETH|nr:toluene hydroxylase [Pseudonocardia thermophila]SHK09797.1 toluene 4-monooxygenase protein E [Pseudonocardia thermophila]